MNPCGYFELEKLRILRIICDQALKPMSWVLAMGFGILATYSRPGSTAHPRRY